MRERGEEFIETMPDVRELQTMAQNIFEFENMAGPPCKKRKIHDVPIPYCYGCRTHMMMRSNSFSFGSPNFDCYGDCC